ncbi:hypothetical protein [Rhodococcus sp. UFZ-B548]|uniref:hypothetical protein n=1 Tax=Rhodococcus sp. UFZ-B548 TaxID=2742212 RepID=UPI0015F3A94A|nr:hypothetical protein [Rhodococcus sp. UFZ-B548]
MTSEQFGGDIIDGPSDRGQIKLTKVAGSDLNQTYIGQLIGRHEGAYNRLGKLQELIPVLTDPAGLWLATIHWGATPDANAETEKIQIRFSDEVEFVEITPN